MIRVQAARLVEPRLGEAPLAAGEARQGMDVDSRFGPTISRFLLVLIAACMLCACGRGASELQDVTMELEVSPEPAQLGPVSITVTLQDAGGLPLEGAEVEVEASMTHAGMVPQIGQGIETSPGVYKADLEFTMGGDWFVAVRALLADGRSTAWIVDLPGVDTICGDTPEP